MDEQNPQSIPETNGEDQKTAEKDSASKETFAETVVQPAQPAQPLPSDGFVCGLIAVILCVCCCGGGIVSPILAIVSLVQRSKYIKAGGENSGKVVAGLILSIIALVIFAVAVVPSIIVNIATGFAAFSEILGAA